MPIGIDVRARQRSVAGSYSSTPPSAGKLVLNAYSLSLTATATISVHVRGSGAFMVQLPGGAAVCDCALAAIASTTARTAAPVDNQTLRVIAISPLNPAPSHHNHGR